MPNVSSFIAFFLNASSALVSGVVLFGASKVTLALPLATASKARVLCSTYAFLAGWYILFFMLAQRGFFEVDKTTIFPTIILGVSTPIAAGLFLAKSWPAFRMMLDAVPPPWLIGIQIYRILGIVFLTLYAQRLLPAEFALPAGYGDIAVGVAALPVAIWYAKHGPYARELAIAWNFMGIADLIIALTTGFFTSPSIIQIFAHEAPNELITAYPLVMITIFAVPLAMLLHIFSLRTLWYHKSVL